MIARGPARGRGVGESASEDHRVGRRRLRARGRDAARSRRPRRDRARARRRAGPGDARRGGRRLAARAASRSSARRTTSCPRGRAVLDEALPDVRDALRRRRRLPLRRARHHAARRSPTATPRPGDERFATITARRPVLEWVLARAAAEAEPGVEVRRGVAASSRSSRAARRHRRTSPACAPTAGEELRGRPRRRRDGPPLAAAAAARRRRRPPVHEEAEDSGFIYYTRFFRARDGGGRPAYRAAPLTPLPSFSVLTLPGDNDTWSVTRLHRRRRPPAQGAAPRGAAGPRSSARARAHAHWLDGEPITGVLAMGGVVDRYRRPVVDGRPVATGVARLGDAWACTNPSLGRGMTLGARPRRAACATFVRHHLEHPREIAEVWDTVTEAELTPWYRVDRRARTAPGGASSRPTAPAARRPPPPDRDGARPRRACRVAAHARRRRLPRDARHPLVPRAARGGPRPPGHRRAGPRARPPTPRRRRRARTARSSSRSSRPDAVTSPAAGRACARPRRAPRAAPRRPRSAAPSAPRRR